MTNNSYDEYNTTILDFLDIQILINEGKLDEAIKELNLISFSNDTFCNKEFLLGHVNFLKNNLSVALLHFINANNSTFMSLPALKAATKILCENGYIKEAAFLIKEITDKFTQKKLILSSDLENIICLFKKYKNKKIISIHQPSYLPWLGYFHKIYYSNNFVIHDSVQFSKKSFIKRSLIRKSNINQSTYLIIPAQKHSDYCFISEMKVNDSIDWRADHIRKIEAAYKKAPYFNSIFPFIISIFKSTTSTSSLVDITFKFTLAILELLEIKREIYFSSSLLNNKKFESPHDKNMELCKILNGSIYLSGGGALNYQEGKPLPDGINLIYQNFWKYIEDNPYVDKSVFINGLSILDALFYIGPKKIIELFENYENPRNNLLF